jgi:hypothetical protein
MSQGTLWFQPIQHFTDANNVNVAGAKAYFYLAGTLTPVAVYSDVGLTTPWTQPVVANASGIFPAIFLTPGVAYKVDVQTAGGVSLTNYPQDNQLSVPASAATVDTSVVAGEALMAGDGVYISDGSGGKQAGQMYKWDSSQVYSSVTPTIGMVPFSVPAGSIGTLRTSGEITGLSGLSVGAAYFVGLNGALSLTAGANVRYVGQADSPTSLLLAANPPPENAGAGYDYVQLQVFAT